MIKINIQNESNQLKSVLVGIANDFGGIPNIDDCYDPKSKEHVQERNCFLVRIIVLKQWMFRFYFEKYNVIVYRPQNIKCLNQIFSRDIAFVIDNKLILPNIIEEGEKKLDAIDFILDNIKILDKIRMPENARAEGGDVLLWNEYVFVGYSENEDFHNYITSRTNKAGLDFLKDNFPNKKVKGFQLNKSDIMVELNTLHLDCCFQPIGSNMAILYKDGLKNDADVDFLVQFLDLKISLKLVKMKCIG